MSVAVVRALAIGRANTAIVSSGIVSAAIALVRGHLDTHATDGVDGTTRDARVGVGGVLGHLG